MTNQEIFFNRAGTICSHAEQTIGSDTFQKITISKATVNPMLTFTSTVMYANQDNKLKMCRNYNFQLAQLRNDEWLDIFIDTFHAQHPECKEILGVLTSDKSIVWYTDFVTTKLNGLYSIERQGQQMIL